MSIVFQFGAVLAKQAAAPEPPAGVAPVVPPRAPEPPTILPRAPEPPTILPRAPEPPSALPRAPEPPEINNDAGEIMPGRDADGNGTKLPPPEATPDKQHWIAQLKLDNLLKRIGVGATGLPTWAQYGIPAGVAGLGAYGLYNMFAGDDEEDEEKHAAANRYSHRRYLRSQHTHSAIARNRKGHKKRDEIKEDMKFDAMPKAAQFGAMLAKQAAEVNLFDGSWQPEESPADFNKRTKFESGLRAGSGGGPRGRALRRQQKQQQGKLQGAASQVKGMAGNLSDSVMGATTQQVVPRNPDIAAPPPKNPTRDIQTGVVPGMMQAGNALANTMTAPFKGMSNMQLQAPVTPPAASPAPPLITSQPHMTGSNSVAVNTPPKPAAPSMLGPASPNQPPPSMLGPATPGLAKPSMLGPANAAPAKPAPSVARGFARPNGKPWFDGTLQGG